MNLSFLNDTRKAAHREYMYEFAESRYQDLMREAEDYRREQHVASKSAAKANKSPLAGLRHLTRVLLTAVTTH